MSLAPLQTEVVKVLDPVVDFHEKRAYAVMQPNNQVTYQQFVANNVSTSSIQVTCNPPSERVAIQRKARIRYFVQFDFAGSGSGNLLQIGTNDALRAFPLTSCMDTVQVSINNTTVTQNIDDYIHAFLHYGVYRDVEDGELSVAPSMLDTYQQYSDWQLYGSAKNVLAEFGENAYQTPRGAFSYNVISNTNTAAQVQCEVVESFFLPPMLFSGRDNGLIGVNTMSVNISLGGNSLSRMWSHSSAGNTLSSVTVSFYQAPQLLFQYVTPDPQMPLPQSIDYPFANVVRYPQSAVSVASGASTTITAQNIQLQSVPEAIYIFARRANADATYSTTDTFAYLSNVSITFNNQANLLSSATPQDLYQIARQNGCDLSWPAWSKYTGSVLKLVPGLDLSLQPGMAPGVQGNYNLLCQATFTNLSAATMNLVMYVVVVNEGTFTIVQGQSIQSTGVVSREDVLKAKSSDIDFAEAEYQARAAGGSFLQSAARWIGKIFKVGSKVLPHVEEALKEGDGIPMAIASGRRRRGGAVISREQLRKNL